MSFFSYLAQVSLYAAIMWGAYCVAWRGKPMLRDSRIFLITGLLLPLILPLIHLPEDQGDIIDRYRIALPEIIVGGAKSSSGNIVATPPWVDIALAGYCGVCGLLTLAYSTAYARVFLKMRTGTGTTMQGYTVYTNSGIGPGTIWRSIFFPGTEIHPSILKHELAHIRAGHRWDAILMQVLHILLWASPAHWFMARELKLVHEYEADRAAASASEREAYTELLLSQSLGAVRVSIGHPFFHHPLKRRILMLHKPHSPRRKMIVPICAGLTAILISTALLAQTKKPARPASRAKRESAREASATTKASPAKAGDYAVLDDGRVVYKFVEQMPSFNGDLSTWLSNNLHYPDSARAHGQAGRSVIRFIVEGDGGVTDAGIVRSSGYPLLDEEALRATAVMPHWRPGVHQGTAVPVYFTLPVTFKLD